MRPSLFLLHPLQNSPTVLRNLKQTLPSSKAPPQHLVHRQTDMSKYNSTLGSFDPFAVHPFTSVSSPSAEGSYQGGSSAKFTNPQNTTVLPSPPPSPRHLPSAAFGSAPTTTGMNGYNNTLGASDPIPINMHTHMHLGSTSSYTDHIARAMNAPPQSMLASPDLPAPSWPDVFVSGRSSSSVSTPLSPSTSASSSSSSVRQPSTHIFRDFHAEVERYQRESDDLPVLKKNRERVYAGF